MKLLAVFFLSQLMTTMSSSMSVAVVQPDEDSLLQEIGKLIGGAIRGVRPEPEPPVAPMAALAFGAPANDGPAPSEKEQQEFSDRLQAYSLAMQAWLEKTCELTLEQKTGIKELFDAKVTDTVTKFAAARDVQRQNQPFPDTLPLLFTQRFGSAAGQNVPGSMSRRSGLAADFSEAITAVIQQKLTDEQKQRLEAAMSEREAFRSEAFLSYVVSIIDKELYLTAGQREALTNELASKKDAIQHPLYSFNPQSYYLPYESVSQIITASAGKNFLEPSQKKRLQDLNSNDPNSQHIIFRSEAGAEEWYKQMNEAGRQQRDKYLRAIAVRVSYYQKELELSSGQIEHLTVAGKGAAVRALGDWKESTENTIEQMQQQMAQMQGNFAFGSQNMDTNAIDQNEIWADAIESIMPGAAVARCEERKNANRAAIAATLTALLDSELWLTPDQRQPVQKLVENSLPARSDPTQNQEYIREIILLAYPLFRTSAEDRDKLLTEPQRDVWKKMESFFQWQKENNYLQIPLRNQGGSFGFTLSN